MFGFNRLYRNRYLERYLNIREGVKKIEAQLAEELKDLELSQIGYWWNRRAMLSTITVNGKPCGCRVDVRVSPSNDSPVIDGIEYRIQLHHQVDAPLWRGAKFRAKLKILANELFAQRREEGAPMVQLTKIGQFVTDYSINGKIKLP